MDIVGALSAQLKLDHNAATGLAGALLLLVEDIVREKVDFATSSRIRVAVPEMRDWQMSSPTLAPGMISLDSLQPVQPSGDEREIVGILARFGVSPLVVDQAAALLYQFLASRLDAASLAVIGGAMPLLKK